MPLFKALAKSTELRVHEFNAKDFANTAWNFATAGHFTFSNACDAFPGLIDGDGCGDGFLPAEEAHAAINTFSLAFARFHLFGEAELEPLLNGEQEVSSDATISARP